jgi:hypothetical protein
MKKILLTALCVLGLTVLGNNFVQAKENPNEKMSIVVTSADNIPSVTESTDSSTTATPTPTPTVAPTITPKPKVTDGDYTGTTLTEEDVKGWDWKKGGIIQIGGYLCYFGQNKTGKVIWIDNYTTTYYGKGIEPDIVVTYEQWKNLKYITYNGIKYKTGIEASHFLTRVTKMKLYAKDKYRSLPRKGDTWVAKNGKKTKITSISYNYVEVPGYGQGIDFYTGLVYETDKSTFKNGDIGGKWNGDDSFNGSPFTVMKDPVYGKIFAYFRIQWKTIQSYEAKKAESIKNPRNGDYCGYFTMFDKSLDMWTWVGPVF